MKLDGDGGFRAEVDDDRWPEVGAPARVARPPYEWPGTVQSFARARRCDVEWTLRSGEVRRAVAYVEPDSEWDTGFTFPLTMRGRTYEAMVVEARPQTKVVISYVIKNGSRSRHDFYADERLRGYYRPDGDNMLLVMLNAEQ